MKTFSEYWRSLSAEQKHALAAAARTSYSLLSQVANGHRNAGGNLSARLKRADLAITDEMLRPDLYTLDSDVA